jgi:hypothetical protein
MELFRVNSELRETCYGLHGPIAIFITALGLTPCAINTWTPFPRGKGTVHSLIKLNATVTS